MHPIESLVARVARLEHAAGRRRRLAGALATAATALVLMGQVLPGGRLLEGEGLVLRDPGGHERVVVRIDESGATLSMRAPSGEELATLASGAGGTTTLRLAERGGKGGIELAVRFDGSVEAALLDRGGTRRAALDLVGFIPTLRLAGLRGSASLSVPGDGPQVLLLDEKERAVFRAPQPDS